MAGKSGRGCSPRHTPYTVNLYPHLLHEGMRPDSPREVTAGLLCQNHRNDRQ